MLWSIFEGFFAGKNVLVSCLARVRNVYEPSTKFWSGQRSDFGVSGGWSEVFSTVQQIFITYALGFIDYVT
jgi:hypothetical protein